MADITPLIHRLKVPGLALPLAGGGSFDLSAEQSSNFTLLVFHRGLHRSICKT